jgi:hypothetical protein
MSILKKHLGCTAEPIAADNLGDDDHQSPRPANVRQAKRGWLKGGLLALFVTAGALGTVGMAQTGAWADQLNPGILTCDQFTGTGASYWLPASSPYVVEVQYAYSVDNGAWQYSPVYWEQNDNYWVYQNAQWFPVVNQVLTGAQPQYEIPGTAGGFHKVTAWVYVYKGANPAWYSLGNCSTGTSITGYGLGNGITIVGLSS